MENKLETELCRSGSGYNLRGALIQRKYSIFIYKMMLAYLLLLIVHATLRENYLVVILERKTKQRERGEVFVAVHTRTHVGRQDLVTMYSCRCV